MFQPLDDGTYDSHNEPQFQVGLAYAWGDPKSDPLTGKVWFDLVSQKLKLSSSVTPLPGQATSYTGTEVDGGVKLDVAGFEGVLYGYTGKGVGTTGLFILSTSALGDKRKSDGGYVQATYKIDKLKIGLSYGISDLKLADDERSFESTGALWSRATSPASSACTTVSPRASRWSASTSTRRPKPGTGTRRRRRTSRSAAFLFF